MKAPKPRRGYVPPAMACASREDGYRQGDGDTPVTDALFLSRICAKVYLVHRRDALRGLKAIWIRSVRPKSYFHANCKISDFLHDKRSPRQIEN
jgi:thioredoxin reductase (NADPH)